jgi:SagB-type dehydrogenase family enzyme
MTGSLFLSLREGASFTSRGEEQILLRVGSWACTFGQLSAGSLSALQQLASRGEYEDRLTKTVLEADGFEALAKFYYYLHHLSQLRLLRRSVRLNGDRLATLVPISRHFEYNSRGVRMDRAYQVSRFAYMRAEEGETVLESPLSHARIILHDWRAAAVVQALGKPMRVDELGNRIDDVSSEAAEQLITLLLNANMLAGLNGVGKSDEGENPALRSWEFHDLLFHSRSRKGRHDYAYGGTYRLVGQLDPPPALKSARSDKFIPLRCPDLDRLKREDPPFALVQELRRSIREYDPKPLTIQQLSEFLYRVGRITQCDESELETSRGRVRMDFAFRPYPSGGALYEMELYLGVKACEDLAAGLYHYDGKNHQLEQISELTNAVQELVLGASQATGIRYEDLQVLIVIAARFQRLSWKYASMAYAAMLKHVGVLYQTMYLAATAMDLAPCGIGGGDSDLFARAAHMNYYDETSVGEFLLGRRRVDASASPQ